MKDEVLSTSAFKSPETSTIKEAEILQEIKEPQTTSADYTPIKSSVDVKNAESLQFSSNDLNSNTSQTLSQIAKSSAETLVGAATLSAKETTASSAKLAAVASETFKDTAKSSAKLASAAASTVKVTAKSSVHLAAAAANTAKETIAGVASFILLLRFSVLQICFIFVGNKIYFVIICMKHMDDKDGNPYFFFLQLL